MYNVSMFVKNSDNNTEIWVFDIERNVRLLRLSVCRFYSLEFLAYNSSILEFGENDSSVMFVLATRSSFNSFKGNKLIYII